MNAIPQGWRPAVAAISLLWVATLAAAGMVFLAQTLLARRLGPDDYGLFASSLATVTMIAPLAGFGLSQFRLKAYGSEGWDADRWMRPALRFSLLTTLLALALVVGWALLGAAGDAGTRTTLLWLAPMVPGLFAVDFVGSKLRLEERHGALALWQLLLPGGRLAIALLAWTAAAASAAQVALGHGLLAILVAAVAIPQLSAMQAGRMRLKGHGPRRMEPPPPSPGVRELWSQAWAYGLSAALYPVFFQVGTVLLKYLGGNAHAGRYGIALAVMTAIYLFPATVYQKYLLSRLHRWAVHDPERFRGAYRTGNAAMLAAGIATGATLALVAPWLVPRVFGAAYGEVATLLQVMSICVPLRFLSTAVGSALLTRDHMRYRVNAMLAATLAAVLLNLWLVPRHQALGAAWATVAAEALLLLAMWRGARRLTRGAGSGGDAR